jgi:hypothetical protein
MFHGLLFNAQHMPLSRYPSHLLARYDHTSADWEALFKFSFVRNPWGRWLSFFFHNSRPRVLLQPKAYHEEFARFLGKSHLCWWGKATPEKMIGDDVDSLDFIGRFEDFDRDALAISDKLGVNTMIVPHRGQSFVCTPDDWQPYYTDETRAMVEKLGAWEIERFGYTF